MTENLAEDPSQTPNEYSDVKADEYQGFYLDRIGASDVVDKIPAYDKRIMSDLPLMVQLEPLPYSKNSKAERDKVVAYFEDQNWLPGTKREANIASGKGVDEVIRSVRRISKGDPAGAARSTYETLKGYYEDSINDNRTLNSVLDPSEDLTINVSLPKLRNSREALYVLGDSLMAREFLDHQEWPNRNWKAYQERQNYWRGFMLFAAEHATDEVLASTFNNLLEKVRNRRNYWSENFKLVNKSLGRFVVEDAAETVIPHKPLEEIEDESKRGPNIENFNELLSDQAVEELAAAAVKYADKTDQIMRYVQDSGMTREVAELRVLGRRAQWHEGFIVGLEPKDEQPTAEAIARAQRPPKNAALNPGVRRLPGYDQQQDPSNPRPI